MTAPLSTVPALLLHRVESTPDAPAFQYPAPGGGWTTVTWREVEQRVRALSCGLRALGLGPEQRCGIMSGTRYEWLLADLAILCAGGATTTIYPSSTADDAAFILSDSEAQLTFAENAEQVAKLVRERERLPHVRKVIVLEGSAPGPEGWVMSLPELEALGREEDARAPGRFEEVARGVKKDALATLIYTSGTTGRPKGVQLTHDCWAYEAETIDSLGLLRPDDVQYLWLPLAHSFGKVLEALQLRVGFLTAVDGRVERLVENLAQVRPTFVAAVPRIFEKVHTKVVMGARSAGGAKAAIFDWAMGVGHQVSRLRQQGRSPGVLLAAQNALADRLVFGKLRARFGGRLRFFVSGSAPLAREISEFFHAAGILILEGYGLTETSAATFLNLPNRLRFGTVGHPLPGTEVRIAPEDGEVLVRGRGVMRGYHRLESETAETLAPGGWLRTGDIGVLEDGFLRLTDRKKELIKTSGGKYVAPQVLEGRLKALCPYVSQVVVHGNNRNFVTALVALDEESIRSWAKTNGLGDKSVAELSREPAVHALVNHSVQELNAGLASFETLKKFSILPRELTLEEGELTPSMKLKRKLVEQRYKDVLDGMYRTGTH